MIVSMHFYLLLYRYKSPKDAETFYNSKFSLPHPQGNAVPVAVAPSLNSVASLDSVAVTPSLDSIASLDSVVITPSLDSIAVQCSPSLDSVAVQTDTLEPSTLIHLFSKLPVETHLQVLSRLFTSYFISFSSR